MLNKKLGRGLDILIGSTENTSTNSSELQYVNINDIVPNKYQPRSSISGESLEQLKQSIQKDGVLQPVLIRKVNGKYEIIAGERRWRACKELNIQSIPCIIKQTQDIDSLYIALIENIFREDLNPVEKAKSFKMLAESFNLTHQQIAERLGLDRSTVTNFIRLLELPDEVSNLIKEGKISYGQARALLSIPDKLKQIHLANRTVQENLSVRKLENIIRRWKGTKKNQSKENILSAYLPEYERTLREFFDTKVKIKLQGKGGKITLTFYSSEQLDKILQKCKPR